MGYVNEGSVLGTAIAFIVLSIPAVAARFGVRRWKSTPIGADDWLSVGALVFVIAYCITMIIGKVFWCQYVSEERH